VIIIICDLVVFPTVVAKGRSKKDNTLQTFVGNEVVLADLFKITLRSAYEGNAVCNVDALVLSFISCQVHNTLRRQMKNKIGINSGSHLFSFWLG
jgi:hypothetical protein